MESGAPTKTPIYRVVLKILNAFIFTGPAGWPLAAEGAHAPRRRTSGGCRTRCRRMHARTHQATAPGALSGSMPN
jgi:hypothetical protein